MPTSTSSIFACPSASESIFASETEIFPPALWPSFVPRTLTFSCCASSAESNDVPAPVSKIKSNGPAPFTRSEEHTSELQSRRDLVCRLLLEKKKTKNNKQVRSGEM